MKCLLPVTTALCLLPILLVGCGEESDSLPADGRDFDAQGYVAGKPYTGRVIDGYLQNARVWLDIDGDGQPTPGPMTVESETGVQLELVGGEPTAMSGEDGVFSLDVSELEQDPLVSPDLDPRDYSLMALALPGQTVEQIPSGGERVLDQAFMLSAPPGVRNITPLTTLVGQRRVNGIGEFLAGTTDLAMALGNINMVSDFVRSGDERAQAYAAAFARFRASQLPQDYRNLLSNGDGTERFLSAEAVNLMGISFARNALAVVRIVDEAAVDGDYGAVDIDSLTLPEIELELDDSMIVRTQKIYARAAGGLPASFTGLDQLAEHAFLYAEDGRLTSVEANGCMAPSLSEIVRVINADGKISATETQWVPALSLNQNSGYFFDEAGTDERLTFDWDSGTAAFETTTTCHAGLASSSELGGPPAIEYQWEMSDGRVTSLTATGDGRTEVLTPDYAFSSDFFIGYTREVNGVAEEIVDLTSAPQSCSGAILEEDADNAQVVSSVQPYTVAGALDIPAGFNAPALELDTRNGLNRPLRYGFLDEDLRDTEGVSNSQGFEWKFYYPATSSDDFFEEQPNLVSTAYLVRYDGDRSCGRDFGRTPSSSYARVEYTYQHLSEYLAGRVQ